jgi:hypothetical protein
MEPTLSLGCLADRHSQCVDSTYIDSTNPIAFAQDESETNTEQEIKQKNVGSGVSTNNNCGVNSIDSGGPVLE